jgi:DNA polymerase III delta prime subunit
MNSINTTNATIEPIPNKKPTLSIYENIKEKLDYFISIQKIPNIIFHGPPGSGKKTLLTDFIEEIYQGNKLKMKQYTMYVNCAYGKGIKFIREELKFFAKTNIQENIFKCIVLLNADKLTVDAQSALRRCIELFNHNTRFFIIIEDKYKLLKPILSRFCEIYVPQPIIHNEETNLHQYHLKNEETKISSLEFLKKQLKQISTQKKKDDLKVKDIIHFSSQLYEKGYCGLDIMTLLENHKFMEKEITLDKRYELLICFQKIIKEIRNEKIILFFMLNFLFLSLDCSLENIFFM